MGCIPSKENKPTGSTTVGAPDNIDGIYDDPDTALDKQQANTQTKEDPHALKAHSTWAPIMDLRVAPPPVRNARPPDYNDQTLFCQVIKMFNDANSIIPLSKTENFEHIIVVDERERASKAIKDCIVAVVWICLLLVRTYKAEAQVRFLSHHNPARPSIRKDEKIAAEFLDQLYEMPDVTQIEDALPLDSHPFTSASSQGHVGIPRLLQTLRVKGQRTLVQEVHRILTDEGPANRHPMILGLLRDLRFNYAEGFNAENMAFDQWQSHWKDALKADQKQPKVLSNISHALIRFIQEQISQYELREKDGSTAISKRKVIFVTGTPIDSKESDNIMKQLMRVPGGSDQFSIEVVLITDDVRNSAIINQQRLDDFESSSKDIYDVTMIDAHEFFRYGPSGVCLAKIFFSEERKIDQMKTGKKSSLYGPAPLSTNGQAAHMLPDVWYVKKLLDRFTEEDVEQMPTQDGNVKPNTQTAIPTTGSATTQ